MLEKEELRRRDKFIICPRLDIFENIQEELESGTTIGFECPVGQPSADQFRKLYEEATKTSLSLKYCEKDGKFVAYKATYVCHHNIRDRGRKTSARDVQCPWSLKVVSKIRSTMSRLKDDMHASCGLVVRGTGHHNHATNIPAALKHRRVGAETDAKLASLFKVHHSPATALQTLDMELREEWGDEYHLKAADRSILPDLNYAYRLYYKIFGQQYGDGRKVAMADRLLELAAGRSDTRVDVTDGSQVVAIVTPLMERVHQLPEAGETVFVDAGGNCDRSQARIFLVMTRTVAGGLPLGVVITNDEAQATLEKGFSLLKSMLPEGAFGGRGASGPRCVMTDDSASERNALKATWPEAIQLLCIFHVLQATWRWLFSQKHGIRQQDRQELMHLTRTMVYAPTEAALLSTAERLREQWGAVYPQFISHQDGLLDRRTEWALCYRAGLPTRGSNTNNTVEAAMRVLKDNVLHRTRMYDLLQLHDVLSHRLSGFYERKLVSFASGRRAPATRQGSGSSSNAGSVPRERITPSEDTPGHYSVVSSDGSTTYTVDSELGICTCPGYIRTGMCKHLSAVRAAAAAVTDVRVNTSVDDRRTMFFVATGRQEMPPEWFSDLVARAPEQAEDPAPAARRRRPAARDHLNWPTAA